MNIQFMLALRYLSGRKLRSFLTTLAVVFGVLVIFGMNLMIPTLLRSFSATMLAASNSVDLTISHRTGNAFSPDALETVRATSDVRVAQGILSRPLNLPADFFDNNPSTVDRVTIVSLVGLDPETAQQMRTYLLQDGRFLQPGDTNASVIAQSLADNLNLAVGDTLPLPTTLGVVNLEIVGILPPRAMPGNEEVLVTLPDAQRMLDAPGKINIVEANYTTSEPERRTAIEQDIRSRFGEDYQFGALSNTSDVFASISTAEAMFNVFGVLALFMGGFIIFNTFRTLVAERRRDIGMLRAVGANRHTIIGLILVEGLIQGGVGTLVGILLGYVLASAGMAAVSPFLEGLLHIAVVSPVVPPNLVIVTVLLGVGITLLAGLLPALSAGRITPIEALRPSIGAINYRRLMSGSAIAGLVLIGISALILVSGNTALITLGAMVFMLGLVLIAPALVRPIALAFGALFAVLMAHQGTGQLAEGNLTRQPTRAAVTASTTMIALAILVVVGGLTNTIKVTFTDIMRRSLGSDYMFFPPAISLWSNNIGASSAFADQIRAIDGVGPVSTFHFANAYADVKPAMPAKGQPAEASTNGVAVSLLGIDPGTFPQVAALTFDKGDPQESYQALASDRAIIGNGVFASTTGLSIGDTVPLITPNGVQNYRLVAIASDFLNVKVVTAYISHANMAADFGKSEDVFIQLNLAPGADAARVESELKAVKRQYPQFNLVSGKDYLDQMMQLLNTAFSGMFLAFIFLTIPSLIAMVNTLAIGVIERTREIGMLRAVGATRKQVRRMILMEALLLAGVGSAFGMLAGVYLSYALIGAFSMAGFPVEFYMPWVGLIYALVIGILTGVVAAIIPARQAARLVIVQALRYE